MPREQWEKGTFGGTHHRPKSPERGRSQRELSERASFDNEPATGCGAVMMVVVVCVLAVFAAVAS